MIYHIGGTEETKNEIKYMMLRFDKHRYWI